MCIQALPTSRTPRCGIPTTPSTWGGRHWLGVIFGIVCVASTPSVSAQDPAVLDARVIVLNGDVAPGYEATGSTFLYGLHSATAHLGSQGHVAFLSAFAGAPGGLFLWHEGALANLWRDDEPLPAGQSSTRKAFSFSLAGIDDKGFLAAQSLLSCPDGSNAGNCTLWVNLVGPSTGYLNYVHPDWALPATGSGRLAINGAGKVAAVGRYFEGNVLREELRVFSSPNAGGSDWVVNSGVDVNSGGDEEMLADRISGLQINGAGEAFVLVTLEDENGSDRSERAIVAGSSWANDEVLAFTGDPAPGPPGLGGLPWLAFQSHKATTDRRIAIQGRVLVDGGGIDGLWFASPTDQQLVFLPGHSSFVGARAGERIASWGTADYGIGRDGGVVFQARTDQGRDGIFRWKAGSLAVLLIEGQAAPGFDGRTVNTVSIFRMNRRGDVLVPGGLSVGGTVLYLFESGVEEPRAVVRPGDVYDQNGEQKTLSAFAMPSGSVDEREVFNDRGQVVLALQSTFPASLGLFLVETSRPAETFRLEGDDALILVQTLAGKSLALRRTSDFVNFTDVATGITGDGEVVEVRDAAVRATFDLAYYVVVIEGDL